MLIPHDHGTFCLGGMGKLLNARGCNSWFTVTQISYLPNTEGWCYLTLMCEHSALNWNIMSYLVAGSLFSLILKSVLFLLMMLNCSVNSGNTGWSKFHATFTTNLLFHLKNSELFVTFLWQYWYIPVCSMFDTWHCVSSV